MSKISKVIVKNLLETTTDYVNVSFTKAQKRTLYQNCSKWVDVPSIECEINQFLFSIGYRYVNHVWNTPLPKDKDTDLMTLELFLKFDAPLTPDQRKIVLDKLFVNLKAIWNEIGIAPDDDEERSTQAFTLTNIENEYSRGWDCEHNKEI